MTGYILGHRYYVAELKVSTQRTLYNVAVNLVNFKRINLFGSN